MRLFFLVRLYKSKEIDMTTKELALELLPVGDTTKVKIQFEGCAIRNVARVFLEVFEDELCFFIEAEDTAF